MPRNQLGELNNNSVLTVRQVATAKGMLAHGGQQAAVARHLGISLANMWAIANGASWVEVAPDLSSEPPAIVHKTSKRCPRCKLVLPYSAFGASGNGRIKSYCRGCHREYGTEMNRQRRRRALKRLGGKCVCCGETRYEFLSFDHIDGGGGAHRRREQHSVIIRKLSEGRLTGFRILCHNCNLSHGFYGYCPHDREKGAAQ